jgi:hypothetical protein
LPQFSEDDFLNFLITEALVARGEIDRQQAAEKSDHDDFLKSHKEWNPQNSPVSGV